MMDTIRGTQRQTQKQNNRYLDTRYTRMVRVRIGKNTSRWMESTLGLLDPATLRCLGKRLTIKHHQPQTQIPRHCGHAVRYSSLHSPGNEHWVTGTEIRSHVSRGCCDRGRCKGQCYLTFSSAVCDWDRTIIGWNWHFGYTLGLRTLVAS